MDSGEGGMDGLDNKKVGLKRNLKSIEFQGDSDDELPIGTLFKIKKLRNPKTKKSDNEEGSEIRAEDSKVSEEVSVNVNIVADMDDTLANFKKKLKVPKIVKESSESNCLVSKQSRVKLSKKFTRALKGQPSVVDESRSLLSTKSTRPRSSSIAKPVEETLKFDDGSDQSDVVKEDSLLSALVPKSRAALIRKKIGETLISDDVQQKVSDKSPKDFLISALVRKTRSASLRKQREENLRTEDPLDRPSVELLKDSLPAPVRRSRSVTYQKKGTETRRFNDGLNQSIDVNMEISIPVSLMKSHCAAIDEQMRETPSSDSGFEEVSVENLKDSQSALLQESGSGSMLKKKEETLMSVDELDLFQITGTTTGAGILKLTEDTQKSGDSFGQTRGVQEDGCSPLAQNHHFASLSLATDETRRSDGTSNDSSSGVIQEFSLVSLSKRLAQVPLNSGISDGGLRQQSYSELQNLQFTQVLESCNFSQAKMPKKIDRLDDGSSQAFDRILDDELKAFPSVEINRDSPRAQVQTSFSASLPEDRSGGLNHISNANQMQDLQMENEGLNKSVALSSVPVKDSSSPRLDGGLSRCYGFVSNDGFSPYSSTLDQALFPKPEVCVDQAPDGALGHKQFFDSNDGLNPLSDENQTFQKPNSAFVYEEETPISEDIPNQTSEDFSKDLPSTQVHESCSFATEKNKEEIPMSSDGSKGKTSTLEKKSQRLTAAQRVLRKVKRRRYGDMTYEGDSDWDDVLMHEERSFSLDDEDRLTRSKTRPDSFSSLFLDADSGAAAAVAAGLKARAPGPAEKIRFKEVLKRRGGLQEYLECRNMILGLWSKDVCRILPLSDCGITNVPLEDESPRAALIREIYSFLDHHGYINVGIAAEKENSRNHGTPQLKLARGNKTRSSYEGKVAADSEEEVAYILGQVKTSENVGLVQNDGPHEDGLPTIPTSSLDANYVEPNKGHLYPTVAEPLSLKNSGELGIDPHAGFVLNHNQALYKEDGFDEIDNQRALYVQSLESETIEKGVRLDPFVLNGVIETSMESGEKVIVIGAGPAGLTAARHLQRHGFRVCILEARNRIGGRVHTDRSSLSVPVDLGASIITGVEADVATERRPDPSSLVCTQLGLELTVLNSECPLYDIVSGVKVPGDLDEALEAEYNSLLDDMVVLVAQNGEAAMKMSLEDGLEYALRKRREAHIASVTPELDLLKVSDDFSSLNAAIAFDSEISTVAESRTPDRNTNRTEDDVLSPLERRVMDWHFANLEYGCAAQLDIVSLPYWNQDDVYGGFGGAHCMIKGGYSTVVESQGKGLDIRLNEVVQEVKYVVGQSKGECPKRSEVRVSTASGHEFVGDAVLVTVPLGCLKANTIKFSPSLPDWKLSSIQRLGFGVLNKVVLEFPFVFWDDNVDYFGATAEETNHRGRCFMFWNLKKTIGAPVLIALVGSSKAFWGASVPDPVASVVTNWGDDPFSRGAYSYVAVGASGEDYDILGRPVENCVFFAGEATCKEHPDTVGGAMMSGLREAVRIIDIMRNSNDYTAEVEAMEAAQRQSDSERNEVRDMMKRLDAGELSNVLCKGSLDGDQKLLTKEALLQDMFLNAKTTAGRLYLVKELLQLPIGVLKAFTGTKEGLSILNSWILDSMGKDGTQLLRHCVRLLVLVSTDLLSVRLSGIGKTVKEKVCVHTSRDIRAVASQLVNMWIEVFRKEKAANGGSRLFKQTSASLNTGDPLKMKPKDTSHAKPPTRAPNDPSESHTPFHMHAKKSDNKPLKSETGNDSKSEANSSRSQSLLQDSRVDDNVMTEEEAAALAAAETARAAALAAAEAYASCEANVLPELPKIPSFHKFARREHVASREDSDFKKKKWPGGVLGKQDCLSEIDSRNCRVRNWSVDFAATCVNLDDSRILGESHNTQRGYSNELLSQMNLREHSGESGAVESRFKKSWVHSTTGSVSGGKDYRATERWQPHPFGADDVVLHSGLHVTDEEDSTKALNHPIVKVEREGQSSCASEAAENKVMLDNQAGGMDQLKQGLVDYVGSLLMPLYKDKKIDKEGYKSILRKSATKVVENSTAAEKAMSISEFLDFKRKNKIRSFVDKLIERHMTSNQNKKS
ncbi:hypothetical protein AMTR_s00182p00016710 [Amborella trichopoda]|uniref:SWIRM domain-containing protein n=1 Tax=Amborella trichopoda TaxID=13333 RepID=U5CST9_AMBTC|nr:hypothetical protein AMTR_s00182p00016710 [Amborella trichopoda]